MKMAFGGVSNLELRRLNNFDLITEVDNYIFAGVQHHHRTLFLNCYTMCMAVNLAVICISLYYIKLLLVGSVPSSLS